MEKLDVTGPVTLATPVYGKFNVATHRSDSTAEPGVWEVSCVVRPFCVLVCRCLRGCCRDYQDSAHRCLVACLACRKTAPKVAS